MKTTNRPTFRRVLETSRTAAAESAWRRAKLASQLRHHLAASGRNRGAHQLAEIKTDAIRLALSLLPEQVHATTDTDYHVGLLSIRWEGHGWLHLPASTELPNSSLEPLGSRAVAG